MRQILNFVFQRNTFKKNGINFINCEIVIYIWRRKITN